MSSLRLGIITGVVLLSSAVSVRADVITVKVVGPDEKPVVGAKITAFTFTQSRGVTGANTLVSDASGTFSVDIPPIPASELSKDKNPPVAFVSISASGLGRAQTLLTLHSGSNTTIRLEKGIALSGKVVDTGGKPLAGVEVRLQSIFLGNGKPGVQLWDEGGNIAIPPVLCKTDASGLWKFRDIPATAVSARVALSDAKYAQNATDILLQGKETRLLVARTAAVILGRVVGADGTPRAGVTVSAQQEEQGAGRASARTDASGSYRLSGLSAGSMAIWVDSAIDRVYRKQPVQEVAAPLRQIFADEGKETVAPNIVLTPGGLVEGSVTDAVDGKPLVGVQIGEPDSSGFYSAASSAVTGPEGKYSLRMPPGKHSLYVNSVPEGYLRTAEAYSEGRVTFNIAEGATVPVAFRLPHALTLSGVAQDASGRPVSGVEIKVGVPGNAPKATTDSDGKWTLKNIEPGNLRIVGANDYEVFAGNEITVSAKESVPPVTLIVRPFKVTPMTGRVVTAAGKPLSGLTVQVMVKMRMGGGGFWHDTQPSRTDDQGRFTLPLIRPENAEVELKIDKPGYKVASGGTLVRQGDHFVFPDVVLSALDAGRVVKGRVLDAAGKPVAEAIVAVPDAETGPGEVRTDAAGRFTLSGVPEATQLLAAKGSQFGAVSVNRKTGSVVVRLAPVKMASGSAAEDRAHAATILWGIKKRSKAAQQQNGRGDYFTSDNAPYSIAPLNFSLALALAKPEGTNPVDDQALAQMIREIAKNSPEHINDWAIPALKDIGVTAVRASAFYEIVLDTPTGPVKQARARQVYQDMQGLTLAGTEHWIVRRVTQMAVLAGMLSLPEESKSWLDKAIAQSKEDPAKPYIGVVAYEAVNGGLPMVRSVLAKANGKERGQMYQQTIARMARINARAAQKLLQDMEADTTLPESEIRDSGPALEVVRALASQEPDAAQKIAEQIKGDNYSSAALALSARQQSDLKKAALLYERAASLRDAAYNPAVIAKIASLAWKNDPALGTKFFKRASQMCREQDNANLFGYSSRVAIAKEYYAIDPGESRLMLAVAAAHLLSSEGLKQDDYGSYRQDLAMAWLPFNVDRALEIAEMLPEKQSKGNADIKNETMTNIAAWLLTEPSKRTKRMLTDYDQYGFEPRDY